MGGNANGNYLLLSSSGGSLNGVCGQFAANGVYEGGIFR